MSENYSFLKYLP